jgi:2'-5' RNA ligase
VRRLFFALWPEREAAERLAAAIAPYLEGIGIEGILAPDLHVTLCFLGSLDPGQEALLVRGAGTLDAGAFALDLDTLDYWSGARSLVLEARRVPGAALELAARLRALARDSGCTPEGTSWRPHVTLARRVPEAALQRAGWPLPPARWPFLRLAAQQLRLVHSPSLPADAPALADATERSGAPRYRRMQAWPLRLPSD